MRSLRNLWLGLGLVVLQLGGGTVALAAPKEKPKPVSQVRNVPRPVVKRVFNAKDKKKLPTSWRITGDTYVSRSEYRDLASGVMELLRRYPPNKYFFVGLGRDPAPVIAFLQNLGEKNVAVNLPGTSNIQWASAGITDADVARHIEAAIPKNILAGERRIVILDVTSSGKTPAVFGPYLDKYLQKRGNKIKPVRLAFSWTNVKQGHYGKALSDWIDTTKWADFANYYGGKYEGHWTPQSGGAGIAEHQRHSMTPGAIPPTQTSPNYAEFRGAVLARMKQDPVLDRFLVTHVRDALAPSQHRLPAVSTILAEARAYPATMTTDLARLVRSLPRREQTSERGPYLSPNGKALDTWLQQSLSEMQQVGLLVPSLAKNTNNRVTTAFIEKLEAAARSNKIGNSEYRRLIGRALSATTMDRPMLTYLNKVYRASDRLRAALEESAAFLYNYNRQQRPGTENTDQNYRLLIAKVDPKRAL